MCSKITHLHLYNSLIRTFNNMAKLGTYYLTLFIDLIAMTGSAILLLYMYFSFDLSSGTLSDIGKTILARPISAISLAPASGVCPSGDKLHFGEWEGTIRGCYCILSFFTGDLFNKNCNSNGVCRGGCTKKQRSSIRCRSLYANNPIPITKWKSTEFCVDYLNSSQYDYFNLLEKSTLTPEECINRGDKPCGILDKMNNILCLPQNETCPINSMIVDANPTMPGYTSYQFKSILAGGTYLHVANGTQSGSVLSQLKLSDGEVCADLGEYSSPYKPYILERRTKIGCQNKFGNYTTNPTYHLVDSFDKYTVYQENNITTAVQKLPFFFDEWTTPRKTSIYSTTFIGFDKECLKSNPINLNRLINNRIYGLNVMNLINLCVGGTIFIAFIALVFSEIDEIRKERNHSFNTFVNLKALLCILCFVVDVLAFIEIFIYNAGSKVGAPCADDITKTVLSIVSDTMHLYFYLAITILICNVLPFITWSIQDKMTEAEKNEATEGYELMNK